MEYRKEIDGLRAIAVLPVILSHAGISWFSGGYVGVDIFFVISGYLITSIILEERKRNTFSIINFYERRARRILPALNVVLIFTTIAAYIFMPAISLKEYSQSLVSVATFSSNVFFYMMSGYFSQASAEKPLLHTWSLAVEEQYYLFLPIMLVLVGMLGKRWLISSVLLMAGASFIVAQGLLSTDAVDANYYLIFSRAWELFFGSILAFISLPKLSVARWKMDLLSIVGISMIAYSVVSFDSETPFPGFYTLVPVLGTCLIIVFADSKYFIGRILSHNVLVFVGLISYSLYLWHQPLFAFVRMKSIGEPSAYLFAMAILSTFILAFLTWKYIERPFRNKVKFTRAFIFRSSAASIVVFFSVGLAGHFYKGFASRFDMPSYTDSITFSPKREECHTTGKNYLRPSEACKYFGDNITWASFGDSHTIEPAYALAKRLERYNEGLVHLSFSGCAPSFLFEVKLPGCTEWIKESLSYLENTKTIANILIGFRYSSFLYGGDHDFYPSLPDLNPAFQFANLSRPLNAREARELYWTSLEAVISKLIAAGKNVYILYPIPELPVNIHKAVTSFSVLGNTTMLDLERSVSAQYYYRRNEFIIRKLDSLPYSEHLHAIKPVEIICDENFCPAVKGGNALYFDDDHLSVAGSTLLIRSIHFEK